jgi:hypothetical protein
MYLDSPWLNATVVATLLICPLAAWLHQPRLKRRTD